MKKPFTLLLYLLIIIFLIYWPYYMKLYESGKIKSETYKDEEFRGIITFWDFPHPSVTDMEGFDFIKRKIELFQYKHPGVIIDFEPLSYKGGYEKLLNSLKDNSFPDIAPVGSDFYFISNGNLQSLNKYLDKDFKNQYRDGVIDAVSSGGNIYGIPFGLYTNVLFLNVDMFNEKEVKTPENGEWSYEEFVADMTKLTYVQGKKDKKYFYGLNTYIANDSYNLWGILLLDGAKAFDGDKYSFFGPQAVSGVQKILDLYNKYKVLAPDSLNGDKDKAWRSFTVDKDTAVLIDESTKIAQLKNLQSKGKLFNFDIAMYPEGDSGIPLTLSPKVYAYGIKKQNDDKKLMMELKFIKYITDDQENLSKLGYIPVKKGVPLDDDKMKKIERAVDYTSYTPKHMNWREINNITIEKIKSGIKNGKEAFDIIEDIRNSVEKN